MFSIVKTVNKLKKYIITGLLMLIFFVITISIIFVIKNFYSKKPLPTLAEIVEFGNFDDLCLTIYYRDLFTLSKPLNNEELIKWSEEYGYKVIVDGSKLVEYTDLLKQITNVVLKPVEYAIRLNARVYYVFETKNDGKIFDVSMWGDGFMLRSDETIYVNGIEVIADDIFYDIIIPFLPEDTVKIFEIYIGR